jgi:ketosteroid isomerase-like protein
VSQENVVIWRGNLDASKRGDWELIAATFDPDILVRTDPRWPESSVFGRETVIRWYRGLVDAAGSDFTSEEITDLGDRLLVRERWNIHGQESGVEGDQRSTAIVTFRVGRIILVEYFLDHHEALTAVGLEE